MVTIACHANSQNRLFRVTSKQITQARCERLVGGGEGVGVDTKGHRWVGVAEAAGDGADIVALAIDTVADQ